MSSKNTQNNDDNTKASFMKNTMEAIAASTGTLKDATSRLRNAVDYDEDQTLLQAEVLSAAGKHAGLLVRFIRFSSETR
jgi:hypothetical protein